MCLPRDGSAVIDNNKVLPAICNFTSVKGPLTNRIKFEFSFHFNALQYEPTSTPLISTLAADPSIIIISPTTIFDWSINSNSRNITTKIILMNSTRRAKKTLRNSTTELKNQTRFVEQND